MRKCILAIFLLLLVACGGGGGGGDSNANESQTYSGKVVINDGYVVTKVCLDVNSDKKCGNGEALATLNDDNSFQITNTEYDPSVNLIAEVKNAGTNSAFVLEAVTDNTADGKYTISSVTTLVKNRMDLKAYSLSVASESVRADLGATSADDLYNVDNAFVNAKADIIFKTIDSILTKVETDHGITFSSALMTAIYNEISTQLATLNDGTAIITGSDIKQADIDAIENNSLYILEKGFYGLEMHNRNTVSVMSMKLKGNILYITDTWLDIYRDGAHQYNKDINIYSKSNGKYTEVTLNADGTISFRLDGENLKAKVISNVDITSVTIKDTMGTNYTDGRYSNFPQLERTVNLTNARKFAFEITGDDQKTIYFYNAEGIEQVIKAYLEP